ncbi:MAG: phosphohydrolase [Thermoprotei archaeon]|nr:MAG: phosphohydrolase [Thermoprotei archaeon]
MKEIFSLINAAKNLVRTGWMLKGVPPAIGETVSQHSWEAAIISLIVSSKLREKGLNVNPYKASTIALVHDLIEGKTGDIPRYSSIILGSRKDKLEKTALTETGLDNAIEKLLIEWFEQKTFESKIAKFSDLLSTYIQAKRYIDNCYKDVKEIADSSLAEAKKIANSIPGLNDVLNEILSWL